LSILRGFYAALFAAAVAATPVAAHAMGDEEFAGPFPSWANVKTNYGAVGDGVTDDTAAIQKGLNALGPNNPTLFFPDGTYRITQTLTLVAQQYVNVIGADPATTSIVWAGASGGTMLYLNGVAYSRFDRLTFIGSSTARYLVDQSWDGITGYFDTGNEYGDDVFQHATKYGIRCGGLGHGCAETSILRSTFQYLHAGIDLCNFNALDIFVWYSAFRNNDKGVANTCGAGNFHVYNSMFASSAVADIAIGNTGVFNFQNNYSTGSNQFINAAGTANPANITVQGNVILDTTDSLSIDVQNFGPVVLIDNTIRSLASVTSGPIVSVTAGNHADLFSIANTFSAGTTGNCTSTAAPAYSNARCHEINDQVVDRSTINPTPPTLPPTPPNNNRQIFEASPTGSGTACTAASPCSVHQAITNAAKAEQAGTIHPVVHIAPGTYNITERITVPATVNSGIQIIGDGHNSHLIAADALKAGPVMRLQGPSKVILRDFSIEGNTYASNGIELENADQPGSRVFMEQATLGQNKTNLFIDRLDYTNVELHNFYALYNSETKATNAAVIVTGGPSAAAGRWQGGATNIFAGEASGNYVNWGVSDGAHFTVLDVWNDACCSQIRAADVSGAGTTFSYAGSQIWLPSRASVAISLNTFQGTAALANLGMSGNVNITDDGGTAQVLGLGLVGSSTTFFSNTSNPTATTEFLDGQTTAKTRPGTGSSQLPEQGCCDTAFLTGTLAQIRSVQPTLSTPLPSGVTDLRFYRVFVSSALTGIHLKAASATPSPPL